MRCLMAQSAGTAQPERIQPFLAAIGLKDYESVFLAEDVSDLRTLRALSDQDLQDMGLPKGPRTKIKHMLGTQVRSGVNRQVTAHSEGHAAAAKAGRPTKVASVVTQPTMRPGSSAAAGGRVLV